MRLISILFTFSIAFIYTSACSNHSSEELPDYIQSLDNVTVYEFDSDPVTSITLIELSTIGNSEDVLFGRISHVDIDDAGNVYISEGSRGNEAIYVFNSDDH
ncbi:MAG: hypothetical protein ACFCU6_15190 [Balneolaceae bacterium]